MLEGLESPVNAMCFLQLFSKCKQTGFVNQGFRKALGSCECRRRLIQTEGARFPGWQAVPHCQAVRIVSWAGLCGGSAVLHLAGCFAPLLDSRQCQTLPSHPRRTPVGRLVLITAQFSHHLPSRVTVECPREPSCSDAASGLAHTQLPLTPLSNFSLLLRFICVLPT